MQMNKLYLLAALGLSAASAMDGSEWYVGDCLVEADFSPTFGYVAFDCGDMCAMYTVDYYGGDEPDVDDECTAEEKADYYNTECYEVGCTDAEKADYYNTECYETPDTGCTDAEKADYYNYECYESYYYSAEVESKK
jgi:hypothetical protein